MMTRRRHGFTLIELLVVMAIISIAATLVGPLAVNQYDRSKQTAEREALLRLLNHYTFNAYSQNQAYTLVTEDNKIVIHRGLPSVDKSWQGDADAVSSETFEFEYLAFPAQQIRLNRHGFWQPSVIEWLEGERELSKELNMKLVESAAQAESGGNDAPLE
ncbi:hypothetical protein CWE21_10915 [Pseudidiomarina aquimaris]|uniref:Type II secretion system protein GspH n=1 Tax=Pseudidiomarina aquimaris TaxID=641841 RepID=A0A432XD43_9GAMM|nr:type II secretion system protein [Pseudidiomarina aquimaris]RUO46658.1 hypothetical protein CWE21_10915 [Pseudidiomarina aquimaris]